MGLSMTGQKLEINTAKHSLFFELLVTLDLLPQSDGGNGNGGEQGRGIEGREDWFQRVRAFEKESDVSIDDMVNTVDSMRRKDKIRQAQLNNKNNLRKVVGSVGSIPENGDDDEDDDDDQIGKELFVRGEKITTKLLDERDASVSEAMEGYL
jgi:hypothetical protein